MVAKSINDRKQDVPFKSTPPLNMNPISEFIWRSSPQNSVQWFSLPKRPNTTQKGYAGVASEWGSLKLPPLLFIRQLYFRRDNFRTFKSFQMNDKLPSSIIFEHLKGRNGNFKTEVKLTQ